MLRGYVGIAGERPQRAQDPVRRRVIARPTGTRTASRSACRAGSSSRSRRRASSSSEVGRRHARQPVSRGAATSTCPRGSSTSNVPPIRARARLHQAALLHQRPARFSTSGATTSRREHSATAARAARPMASSPARRDRLRPERRHLHRAQLAIRALRHGLEDRPQRQGRDSTNTMTRPARRSREIRRRPTSPAATCPPIASCCNRRRPATSVAESSRMN